MADRASSIESKASPEEGVEVLVELLMVVEAELLATSNPGREARRKPLLFVVGETCDGVLIEAKPRALAVDLSQNALLVNPLDGAVHPAHGHNLVALFQVVHHLLMFFFALLLRTVNEEVEDPDDKHKRKQEANEPSSAAARLTDEKDRIEDR
jgi:hypothetical protein